MEIKEFIEKFAEAIEVDNVETLCAETKFRELEEWSSIAVMLLVAFFDEEFEKEISGADIQNCTTIEDLYKFATA
jgi:acyl carrier protein